MKNLDEGGKGRAKKEKKEITVPAALAKFRSLDPAAKDKYVTRIIAAVVVLAVAAYALKTMLPERTAVQPDPGGTEPVSQEGIDPSTGLPYGYGDGGYGVDPSTQQGQSSGNNAWGDDGRAFRYDGYEILEGQTLNAVDPTGNKVFRFTVPLGFGVFEQNGGAYVKPTSMDVSAQSSDPLHFQWRIPEGLDSLMADGKYDALAGREDPYRLESTLTAVDYYEGELLDGTAMPVVIAERIIRYAPDPDGGEVYDEDLHEYWIVMHCGGQCFVGTVDAEIAGLYLSQRYPTLSAIARTMAPPVSDDGFPAAWTFGHGHAAQEPEYDGPDGDGGEEGVPPGGGDVPDGGQDDGTE